ncbi:hypothetical protein ABZY45_13990 [Streptomyces sp. NPDC006516]|uniref:hypothetical protein n=1 Tax=Streptomyces sp. NPDC006516 TaxID=3154309 RepID=UPI0033BE8EB5
MSGRVLTAMGPYLRAYDRLAYASASRRPRLKLLALNDLRQRAARVPAQLWPSWAMRLAKYVPAVTALAERGHPKVVGVA